MTPEKLPLCTLLVTPARAADMSLRDWETVIVQARKSKLLGLLHHVLSISGHAHHVPERVWNHLASAAQLVAEQHLSLGHEIRQILDALKSVDGRIVVLKGGAYVLRGLAAGHGRTFSDIDILVPREKLGEVEARLMVDGWVSQHRDAYDQRYYRQWMHEIPPMSHIRRGTTLDIHHALTPLTSRIRADSSAMLAAAEPLASDKRLMTLSPQDMVLHSATHLFLESEFHSGLRDLFDLYSLVTEFRSRDAGFDQKLLARSAGVGLTRPLFLAFRYLHRILSLDIPTHTASELQRVAPNPLHLKVLDTLFTRALSPHHESAMDAMTPVSLYLLYLRGHWLRMPIHLLVVHLSRKAVMKLTKKTDNDDESETAR
ncbi:nucleotidyltransferase family protein [Methyloversatilis sp.]|uniref:nucleotidyltransferase domain-containing protein n=1 Tax=Methyloversatilis sp. TaxID=2569862 RepID=UPI0027B8B949|nr:nucleotidyltransferase family protein [Methyloversatilis sp.]